MTATSLHLHLSLSFYSLQNLPLTHHSIIISLFPLYYCDSSIFFLHVVLCVVWLRPAAVIPEFPSLVSIKFIRLISLLFVRLCLRRGIEVHKASEECPVQKENLWAPLHLIRATLNQSTNQTIPAVLQSSLFSLDIPPAYYPAAVLTTHTSTYYAASYHDADVWPDSLIYDF